MRQAEAILVILSGTMLVVTLYQKAAISLIHAALSSVSPAPLANGQQDCNCPSFGRSQSQRTSIYSSLIMIALDQLNSARNGYGRA